MNSPQKRNSLLCPNCRRLVSRTAASCTHCGLKKPGALWNDNFFTRGTSGESVLRVILVMNVIMFIFSLLIDFRPTGFGGSAFNFLSPSNNSLLVLGSTGTIPIFQFGRWWSLLAANYLHGSLVHIIFNMIALHQLGPLLIREYGTSRFISIYTLSGIGGFLISSFLGVRFTIGASAAVCGLIGAALYYGKSRGGTYGDAIYSQIGGWAIGIFAFGFLVPGINNWGHGGGMVTGVVCALLLGYQEKGREHIGHKFLSMSCIIVTGLVLLYSIYNGILFLFLR